MKHITRKQALTVTLFFVFSFGITYACGPYFPIFFHTPETIKKLSFSEIGLDFSTLDSSDIVIPSEDVDIRTLYPIYRKIIGKPLSYQTKKSLYYVESDTSYYDENYSYPPEPSNVWEKETTGSVSAWSREKWITLCLPETYATANIALKTRKASYSKSDLSEWISNQNMVFASCATAVHPSETVTREENIKWYSRVALYVKNTAKKVASFFKKEEKVVIVKQECVTKECLFTVKYKGMLQQDYEYQQAAISYYTLDFNLASKQFKVIAETKNHPWQAYATYTLGRVYLFLGDETKKNVEYDKQAMDQFTTLISTNVYKNISNDQLKELRISAENTINRIMYKKDEQLLETTNKVEAIRVILDDLQSKNIPDSISSHTEYVQWYYAWTGTSTLSFTKKKYQDAKQTAWLLPLVKNIKKSDSMFSEVEKAVGQIPANSPVYWTAHYYLIKSYVDAGDKDTANKLLSQLPKTTNSLLFNYFENLKMMSTDNLTDMYKYSIRYAVTSDYISDGRDDAKIKQIQFIDDKAKAIFEHIPLEKQAEIFSNDGVLPSSQMELIRLTIFVRAVLYGNFTIADQMATLISNHNQNIGNDLREYMNAKNAEDKKFTSALFMLKYPGAGLWFYDDAVVKVPYQTLSTAMMWEDNLVTSYKTVSNYDYNRWDYCQPYKYVEDSNSYETVSTDFREYGYDISFMETLLSKNEIASAITQSKFMYVVPPNYFAEVVLSYAKAHPKDARVPEALSLATKMTKYSTCKNDDTSGYSKKMFKLLHDKYPNSIWAKQTTVYY
ncbi:MAG: hypothetical protein KBC41_03665 [Candidatus Pacebacteria bacterium]|nr:hypothetical protein [Candidatus Paceibacterota bacterium]